MDYIQNLPLRQEQKSQKFDFLSNCVTIDSSNNESVFMRTPEAMSVKRAKEALTRCVISPKEGLQALSNLEALREALTIFFQRNNTEALSSNIKAVPTFSNPQFQALELSKETKETFARIGARARREFIEEQTARAYQYNIPFNIQNVNFLELSQKIDEHEELLTTAREQGIDWDISEYDPVALKQEIEAQESYYRMERNDLYSCFAATRGLEV